MSTHLKGSISGKLKSIGLIVTRNYWYGKVLLPSILNSLDVKGWNSLYFYSL
jgi:hypothetical protein